MKIVKQTKGSITVQVGRSKKNTFLIEEHEERGVTLSCDHSIVVIPYTSSGIGIETRYEES